MDELYSLIANGIEDSDRAIELYWELIDRAEKAEAECASLRAERDALRKAAEGIASDIPDLYGDHVEGGWLSVNLSADAVDELFAAIASVAPGTVAASPAKGEKK